MSLRENLSGVRLTPTTVLWALAIVMLAGLLWNHYQLITFPTLLDYYEGAMPVATETILAGINPYALDSQPAQINVYPPLYNLVVALISPVFGSGLVVHRFVAALFILASVVLCYSVSYRINKSMLGAVLAAVIFYAGLLYFSTPVASSNSLGLFLFLLSVIVPWLGRFTYPALLAALVAGLLAFYSKQYFVAGLGYVGLYVFLCISKERALVFGACCAVAFSLCVYGVQLASPYYFDDVIFSLQGVIGVYSSYKNSLFQLVWYSKVYLGLILLLVFSLLRAWYSKSHHKQPAWVSLSDKRVGGIKFDIRHMEQPLLNLSLNYFWYCFICSLAVISLVLGKNPGNQMTYLFQLMTPFFVISAFTFLAPLRDIRWISATLIAYTLYTSYSMLPTDFTYQPEGWDRLEQVLAGQSPVYATPLALPILSKSREKIYNNGFSSFFYFSRGKPESLKRDTVGESNVALWESYVRGVHRQIKDKKFARIAIDPWSRIPELVPDDSNNRIGLKLLRQNYKVIESIPLVMANRSGGGSYTVKIWEPKK